MIPTYVTSNAVPRLKISANVHKLSRDQKISSNLYFIYQQYFDSFHLTSSLYRAGTHSSFTKVFLLSQAITLASHFHQPIRVFHLQPNNQSEARTRTKRHLRANSFSSLKINRIICNAIFTLEHAPNWRLPIGHFSSQQGFWLAESITYVTKLPTKIHFSML